MTDTTNTEQNRVAAGGRLQRFVMWIFRKAYGRTPSSGEKWILKDGSPWGSKHKPITVLDVKSGWVRYEIGTVFNDERLKMGDFLFCYQPYDT